MEDINIAVINPSGMETLTVGKRWFKSDCYSISVRGFCPICKKEMYLPPHYQILSNEQMTAKGWEEVAPFMWVSPPSPCSRTCQEKSKK